MAVNLIGCISKSQTSTPTIETAHIRHSLIKIACWWDTRVYIAMTRKSFISKLANVVINKVPYTTQVQEVRSWSIHITDDTDFTDFVDSHPDKACRSVNADDIAYPPCFENADFINNKDLPTRESPILNVSNVTEPQNVPSEENTSDGSVPLALKKDKNEKLEPFRLKSMWGNFKFNYACSMARVKDKRKNSIKDYYLINVYSPQHQLDKANLWNFLRLFIHDHNGKVVLFGDLNKVRDISERFGSSFSSGDATIFNSFIQDVDVVKAAWVNLSSGEVGSVLAFHCKLKGLKLHLKQWYSQIKYSECSKRRDITDSLRTIENLIDAGNTTDEDREPRIRKLHDLDNLEKLDSLDLLQKARIKWDVEGDENLKFFHCIINARRKY
uniref:RNA-directed DNA polymerase, eukaryota, reverse transcriptase zinc-binding domain protein n=1 Tax=Tanacetum cinerariifolium TaxID=118510 RepID=A0A6L2N6S5_TANCI|nr:RNA-directed DNA polymerase, eukaryota, reverse transcriptase zinc-binding domain protein [Tanacetum cinerariifolium]